MSTRTASHPDVVFEYAREKGVSIEVAAEDFEIVFECDEAAVNSWIERDRQMRRDRRLLDAVSPSRAYDHAVLRALKDLGAPARVGDLESTLTERFPTPPLRGRMWTGQRIARACQRLRGEGLVSTAPLHVAGATQYALVYSLTDRGTRNAEGLEPEDPRPAEWR